MKSTIKLAIIFLATLSCTTYTVKQKRVSPAKRYQKRADHCINRGNLVPTNILKQLDAQSKKTAERHNNSPLSEQPFRQLMNK